MFLLEDMAIQVLMVTVVVISTLALVYFAAALLGEWRSSRRTRSSQRHMARARKTSIHS